MSMREPELLVAPSNLESLAVHEVLCCRQPPLNKVSFVQNLRKSDISVSFALSLVITGVVVDYLLYFSLAIYMTRLIGNSPRSVSPVRSMMFGLLFHTRALADKRGICDRCSACEFRVPSCNCTEGLASIETHRQ